MKHLSECAAALFATAAASAALAAFPAGAPIDATIPKTTWTVTVEDVLTIPNSGANQPPRIETLVAGGTPGLAYVVDQRGKVYTFDPSDASPTPELWLDMGASAPSFYDGPQRGVRGLAFHPDFNNQGTDGYRKSYTSSSRSAFSGPLFGDPKVFNSPSSPDHDSIVSEWTATADGSVDVSSYRELVLVGQPNDDHNVGAITFNSSAQPGDADYGMLYIPLGDGGGVQDPSNLAQNISTTAAGSSGKGFAHGSILRINPLASGGDPYSVPADNPFFGAANTIPEVYAYGLRNPHRVTFDPVSGRMLISDIGQFSAEEINLGAPGANYGWDVREGTFVTTGNPDVVDDLPPGHPTDPYAYPVAQYDHDPDNNGSVEGSWAVVGGPVYRGSALPELAGKYFFADFGTNSGPIYAVDIADLVPRDDFSNLASLSDGSLAPFEEVRLVYNGQEQTMLEIVRSAAPGSPNRTDIRFGVGPDGEVYLTNKQDGVVRRLSAVSGLLAGDYNGDGAVDAADFTVWRDSRGQSGAGLAADGDRSGEVNLLDYQLWVENYGLADPTPVAAESPAAPEPTSVALVALGAALAVWRRPSKGASIG